MGTVIDFSQSITAEKTLVRMSNDINVLLRLPLADLAKAELVDESGKKYSAFEVLRELSQHLFALCGEIDGEMMRLARRVPTPDSPGGTAA
jgi:hypothetical protein